MKRERREKKWGGEEVSGRGRWNRSVINDKRWQSVGPRLSGPRHGSLTTRPPPVRRGDEEDSRKGGAFPFSFSSPSNRHPLASVLLSDCFPPPAHVSTTCPFSHCLVSMRAKHVVDDLI